MNEIKILRAGLATALLAGCSSIPEMTSQDGSTFALTRNIVTYATAAGPKTKCEFKEASELWICEDGITSTLTTVRLPLSFQGVMLVEFDGKSFTNPTLLGE